MPEGEWDHQRAKREKRETLYLNCVGPGLQIQVKEETHSGAKMFEASRGRALGIELGI